MVVGSTPIPLIAPLPLPKEILCLLLFDFVLISHLCMVRGAKALRVMLAIIEDLFEHPRRFREQRGIGRVPVGISIGLTIGGTDAIKDTDWPTGLTTFGFSGRPATGLHHPSFLLDTRIRSRCPCRRSFGRGAERKCAWDRSFGSTMRLSAVFL